MKKLICLLAAAALLVCCALPAFAEASGVSRADYTITAYSVDATLHENNTVTQTERITVDFAVPSRGIYRVLPVALWVEKDTADGPQEMAYRARVRDLAVTGEGQTAGAPVETDTEDGFYSIRIGDEDTWLTGVQTYELTFTYDIGDDRVAAYDELFYSLNGGQWDAPIEDFRFSFTFEKPLTQEQARSVSPTTEFNVFAFLRQLQAGQTASVWKSILEEQAKGEEPLFYLLAMLQREARQLWQILAGEQVRMGPSDQQAKQQTASRLGAAGLAKLWDAMHTAELSVKSGRRSPSQALDALMGDLTLLFTPAQRRSPR